MDADSERIVRKQLVHESELYEKLKARFYELVLAVRTLKEAEKKVRQTGTTIESITV